MIREAQADRTDRIKQDLKVLDVPGGLTQARSAGLSPGHRHLHTAGSVQTSALAQPAAGMLRWSQGLLVFPPPLYLAVPVGAGGLYSPGTRLCSNPRERWYVLVMPAPQPQEEVLCPRYARSSTQG